MAEQLREDLSFCFCGDGAVVLDLARNRYIGLVGKAVVELRSIVDGTQADPRMFESGSLLGRLVAADGNPRPCQLEQPARHSIWPLGPVRPGPVAYARAAGSIAATWIILKTRSIQGIVDWLRRSKLATSGRQQSGAAVLAERPLRLIVANEALFRLIGREGHCLLRASALAHSLGREGLEATFVIGIAQQPFEAHSWVQIGDVVVSDRLEAVTSYTPVLAL